MSKLLTPRAGARSLDDLGERAAFVGGQRIGRARRRRARSLTRLRRVVGSVLLVALAAGALGFGLRWLLTSPRFAVSAVEVRGASRVPAERILEVSGIAAGANLLRVRAREVMARVEALPGIRRAEVIRELPDRLVIVVEERRPFTLVHAGRLVWVDEEGRVLGEERRAVAPAVPLISGLGDDALATRTDAGPRARAALGLIRTLLRSGSGLTDEISEIDMGRSEGPVLLTMGGVEVHLGGEDWGDRLARLEGVLAQVASQDARVRAVDLRFRDQVVLRRGGQP